MTMHLEIVRTTLTTPDGQPFHARVVSDRGNTEPQWATETYKTKRSAEKACVRLAEMFGWFDVTLEWNDDRTTGRLLSHGGVTISGIKYLDQRES